jgi:hypothetical protein
LTIVLLVALCDPSYATDNFERILLIIVTLVLTANIVFWTLVLYLRRRCAVIAKLPGFPVIQSHPTDDA